MKLILISLSTIVFFLSSCASTTSEFPRGPASLASEIASTSKETSSTKMADIYLKYKLIKDSGFGNIDTQDCKAYAQRNAIHCKSKDCSAVLNEQEFQCEDPACKAFLSEREELCPDQICKALISNHPEKCGSNSLCVSVVTQESATCKDNKDCKAFIEKTGVVCESSKCKGIVNENLNFCDAAQN